MFGQANDQSDNTAIPAQAIDDVLQSENNDVVTPTPEEANPALPPSRDEQFTPPAPEPVRDEQFSPAPEPVAPEPQPVKDDQFTSVPAVDPSNSPSPQTLNDNNHADDSTPSVDGNDLIDIKQRALTELEPLVDQLEQSAEERFRTTMMMIQASDNQHLLTAAYEAAHAIEDEKIRAQALLDIVNEINYFTSQHHDA